MVRNFRRPVTAATAGAYPAQALAPMIMSPTVVAGGGGGGGSDLALGMMIGEDLEARRNRETPAAPISTARRADPDAGGGSASFDAGASANDYTAPPANVDTGGSSSSFDSGSSSSFDTGSSFDSGGSSSSFDSGGGGVDSGGGGSDF